MASLKEMKEQMERNHNNNFIVIEHSVIELATKNNIITKIGESYSKNGNVYYEINNLYNTVLMHVKDRKYIVINRYVKCDNKIIELTRELEKFSFCAKLTSCTRERVIWGLSENYKRKENTMLKQIPIERIIISYMLLGVLKVLPSNFVIHHKAETWDNREATMLFIHEKLHKHRNRHRSGRYIDCVEKFISLITELNMNDKYYRGIKEVK